MYEYIIELQKKYETLYKMAKISKKNCSYDDNFYEQFCIGRITILEEILHDLKVIIDSEQKYNK